MTTELTDACNHYYNLKDQLATHELILQNLLDDALLYIGQTDLSEIDAIISHLRDVEAAQAEVNKTQAEMSRTTQTIVKLMKLVGIPTGLQLKGVIPYELEYTICIDEKATIHISKIKYLEPEPYDPNVIIVKNSDGSYYRMEIIETGFDTASSENEVDTDTEFNAFRASSDE